MVIESIIDLIFTVFRFIIHYLPYDDQLIIADRVLDIYGYSVYMVGSSFFTYFTGLLFSTLILKAGFKLVLFVVNIVRGSGA